MPDNTHESREKFRTKKVLKKIAELQFAGLDMHQIRDVVNKEFKFEMTDATIKNILKKEVIRRKEFIQTDKEFSKFYKEILFKLVSRAESNLKILEKTRELILNRLEELKKDIPESKLMIYSREISNAVRTQNDSIRSMSELLKHMQTETTEVKISTVQAVQETVKILKDLENENYITILPEFYESDLNKNTIKLKQTKKKEEKEEEDDESI